MLYREGESLPYVFIVKQGEFEVTKKIVKERKESVNIRGLIGPRRSPSAEPDKDLRMSKGNKISKIKKIVENVKV